MLIWSSPTFHKKIYIGQLHLLVICGIRSDRLQTGKRESNGRKHRAAPFAIKVVYEQYLMMYCLFNLSCCMNTFMKSMLGDDFPDFNFLYSIYHARFGALISLLLVYWTRILFLKHIYLHW